jgi:hypothetical protein
VPSIWARSGHAAEADAEEIAVDGDAAVVGLAGVFTHTVAELDNRLVRVLDDGGESGLSREFAKLSGVQVVGVMADAPRPRRAWVGARRETYLTGAESVVGSALGRVRVVPVGFLALDLAGLVLDDVLVPRWQTPGGGGCRLFAGGRQPERRFCHRCLCSDSAVRVRQ